MQKVRVAQNSFQFGEVSDSLVMRTDTAVYPASAQRVENMVVTAEGSLKKRYGLKHIYDYGLSYSSSNTDTPNLTNAVYDEVSFDTSAKETGPSGVFFKDDGTRFYIIGSSSDYVHEYSMNPAWDLSSGSFVQTLTGMGSNPRKIFFKSDGTKLYSVRTAVISERTLSTAWDISTAAAEVTFSVSSQASTPSGLFFKPDGTKVFITGTTNDSVYEYTLSTAWDISTASYTQALDLSSEPYDNPLDVKFTSDGKKMFILGTFVSASSEDSVYQFSLSTAWDISTASYDNISFSVNAQGSAGQGIFFKTDDSKMYYVDTTSSEIYQYSTTTEEEQSHLFPFVFDQNEEYVISVENRRVRCFRLLTDGTVSLVANITQDVNSNALPFDREYIKQYTATQRGDVMWICHPLFAPRLLTRTSLTTFEISTYTFDRRLDNSITFQPYSKFQDHGTTLDPSATSGNGITLTTSTAYWDTTGEQSSGNYLSSLHVGVTVRYSGNEIEITSVQSATQATGNVVDELSTRLSVLNPFRTIDSSTTVEVTMINHGFSGSETITISGASATGGINTGNLNGSRTVNGIIDENTFTFTAGGSASSAEDGGGQVTITTHAPRADWDEQSFSAKRGYPAAVTFHENRLVYGGTIAEPDALWFSKVGEYFNFDVGEAADADSINLIAATGDVNEIRYLISNRDLQVFTASSELYVPTYLNQAITPTNAQIRKQTPFGTEFVKPVEIDGATIFCELNGRIIREYLYTDAEDAYSSIAISTIASHLIDTPKYAGVAHSGFGLPDSYAAFTMTNGEMVLFTSNRAERRAAWTRVTTSGTFGSVCAIEDRIFANVYDSDGNLQLCEFDTEVGLDFWLYNSITEASSNLSNASYDSIALDVSAQDATPSGLFFKADGTTLYTTGTTNDDIYQYSLSTAWDITTASYVQTLVSDYNPRNLFFKPDGTELYIVRSIPSFANNLVEQHTLSTAWDISTSSSTQTFSIATQDTSAQGIFFKSDGTKMFVTGIQNDAVYEYALSTAWDISTASYTQNFSLTGQGYDAPLDLFFNADGTKMFILGAFDSPSSTDSVYQYSLSTAWDVSTLSYDSVSFSVNAEDYAGQALYFKDDNSKMYIAGPITSKIHQYSTPTHLIDVSAVYSSGDSVDVIAIKNSTQYSLGSFTVNASNQVALSASTYSNAYVGKKYTAKIITNAVDASMGNGPATGTPRGITNIVLDLKNANSVKVNSRKPSMVAGFTGKKEFRSLGYSRDPQITIEQDDPLTMQVNGIVTELIV